MILCALLLLLSIQSREALGWLVPCDGSIKPAHGRVIVLSVPVHASESEVYQETAAEHRIRLFWEGHPFQAAERVVHRVVTVGGTSSSSRLIQNTISDSNNEEVFTRFFAGDRAKSEDYFTQHWTDRGGNTKKQSFRLDLAYAGQYFCGWQRQPNNLDLPSVQAAVEHAVAEAFCGADDGPPPNVRVSGRTDAGVHAVGQVARVRIRRKGDKIVTSNELLEALEVAAKATNYTWRCLSVTATSDSFHPTFDSKARSYVYLIDADALSELCRSFVHRDDCIPFSSDDSADSCLQLQLLVERMNALLISLEGKELDFFGFSYGKGKTQSTLCRLQHARARLWEETDSSSSRVFAIELTGDRFLRRMVRILVATVLHLALTSLDDDNTLTGNVTNTLFNDRKLMEICAAQDRQRTAKAAPPGGLIFVGATLD